MYINVRTSAHMPNGLDNVHVTFIKQMITASVRAPAQVGWVSDAFCISIKHIMRIAAHTQLKIRMVYCLRDDKRIVTRYISINLLFSVQIVVRIHSCWMTGWLADGLVELVANNYVTSWRNNDKHIVKRVKSVTKMKSWWQFVATRKSERIFMIQFKLFARQN